jgi:2,3-bisphosphoglycerate-independent phosphoglycerate mutase
VVEVLVILDGASEPARGPTSLEAARTPVLDGLCAGGALSRVRTVAPWLPAGSESAIPTLLGWVPPAPVDRGAVEAAAYGVPLVAGQRAWRVDVFGYEGRGAGAAATSRAAASLRAALGPHFEVHRLAGHRLLVRGPDDRRFSSSGGKENVGHRLRWWAEGVVPPRVLDSSTTVVAARGAAAGIAQLMGASVVVPPGATGGPDTDLHAKAAAAVAAIEREAARIIVHVGAPDEAAHDRDPAAKVAAIERIDQELLPPLVAATRRAKGTLRVIPDHGCDPRTGEHDADPVPCLDWSAFGAPASGPTGARTRSAASTVSRLTERAVAALPVVDLTARATKAAA